MVIYSHWGHQQTMPVITIRCGRLSRRRLERGAPGKQLVHHAGKQVERVKKFRKHPYKFSEHPINREAKLAFFIQETHHTQTRIEKIAAGYRRRGSITLFYSRVPRENSRVLKSTKIPNGICSTKRGTFHNSAKGKGDYYATMRQT